jgi:predicted ArsR family transcriptional regulator
MRRQHSKHIFSTLAPGGCYDVENTSNGEKFRSCNPAEVARYIRAHSRSEGHYALGTVVHNAIDRVGAAIGRRPPDCLPCAEREAALNRLIPKS